MGIDWKQEDRNYETSVSYNSESKYIKHMKEEVDLLCEKLLVESQKFDEEAFFLKIHKYVKNNERLLYTNITNFIFSKNEEDVGTYQTNLDKVINYMYSKEFEETHSNNQKLNRTKRIILKMWDHSNLAKRQYTQFHQTDEDYTRIVKLKLADAENHILKNVNSQLISLIAIFTAMAFVVFGGINTLDNIFQHIRDGVPIIKAMILGLIWGICILNCLFAFFYFIFKIIKVNELEDCSIVRKYPIVFIGNLILITLLMVCSLIYFIDIKNLGGWLYHLFSGNVILIIGFLGILIFFVGGLIFICKKYDNYY